MLAPCSQPRFPVHTFCHLQKVCAVLEPVSTHLPTP